LPPRLSERTLSPVPSAHSSPASAAADTKLRVPARDGVVTLMAATRGFDAIGMQPLDVTLRKPTLDDVFLALTGDRPAA